MSINKGTDTIDEIKAEDMLIVEEIDKIQAESRSIILRGPQKNLKRDVDDNHSSMTWLQLV